MASNLDLQCELYLNTRLVKYFREWWSILILKILILKYFRRQCHSLAIQRCGIAIIISFIFFPFFGLSEIFCSILTFKQHSHAHYLGIKEETSISQGFKSCWSFERLTKTYKYLRGKIQLCIKKYYNLVGVREISKALLVLFCENCIEL